MTGLFYLGWLFGWVIITGVVFIFTEDTSDAENRAIGTLVVGAFPPLAFVIPIVWGAKYLRKYVQDKRVERARVAQAVANRMTK